MALVVNEGMRKEYESLFSSALIKADQVGLVRASADFILKNRAVFEDVAREVGCPWCFVGILSVMEAGHRLDRWLANGDSLQGQTVNVPARLKVPGEAAPYSWRGAAIVSLKHHDFHLVDQWDFVTMLYAFERWNGWGYRNRGHKSQYLWASTQYEEPGRYIADGKWSDSALSDQAGCAALLMYLASKGINTLEIPGKSPVTYSLPGVPTWHEEYRHDGGWRTIVTWDGNTGLEVDRLEKVNSAEIIAAYLLKYTATAKTTLLADSSKTLPAKPTREAPKPVQGFTREKALALAIAECQQDISWRANGRAKKYTAKFEGVFGKGRFSWCAAFVSWCVETAGLNLPVHVPGDVDNYTFALCEAWQNWAVRNRFWIEGGTNVKPQAGDIVIFDWDGATHPDQPGDWEDHIGFVMEDQGSNVKCAEGNVEDRTQFKVRSKSVIQGYIRIPDGFRF